MRVPKFPVVLPSGEMIPHLSARRRHEVMDIVFVQTGGVERLVHEMNRDKEGYWAGMQLWSKGLPKAVATEHSVNANSVEDLWDRVEKRKAELAERRGDIIDVTPEPVKAEDA